MILAAALAAAWASAPAHAAQAYHAPRTAQGQPDLQGFWSSASLTDLEREPGAPLTFATRAEEDAFARRAAAAWAMGEAGGVGQGVSEWHPRFDFARVRGKLRTSWITWPADGRLPWRAEGLARYKAGLRDALAETADGPEARTTAERCLFGGLGSANPPMMNPPVGAAKQIVQTGGREGGEVAILSEMNHDVRIVRLGGRHLPPAVRPWMGDSVGHWEGETLVVETTNFHPQEGWRNAFLLSPGARVVERFTRTGPRELIYAFEVDDPATYTAVWKGEMPLLADAGPIYEYACHEGETDVAQILAASRRREAAQGASTPASR